MSAREDIRAWRSGRGWRVAGAAPLAVPRLGALLRLREHAWLIPVALLALGLRAFPLELAAWVPDNYEYRDAARRLLAGDFPLSEIVPPGVAMILAPFFAFLPDSFWTMQAVVIAASLALTPLGYAAVYARTRNRIAAVFLALLIAVSPYVLRASRSGNFDVLDSFLLAVAVFGLPALRGRVAWAFVIYGGLLFLLLSLHLTNAAAFPAVLAYWLWLDQGSFRPPALRRCFTSRQFLTVAATVVSLFGLSVLFSGWSGNASRAPVTLEEFGDNTWFYLRAGSNKWLVLGLLPLGALGMRDLWRKERGLAIALGLIILLWPLVYSPFTFHQARYVLPVNLCVYFLAAMGMAALLRTDAQTSKANVVTARALAVAAVVCLPAAFLLTTAPLVARWHVFVAETDEGIAREMRPYVRGLEPGALLVSAMARGFEDSSPRLRYFDLLDEFVRHGSGATGRAAVVEAVGGSLASGQAAYYLHSHYEQGVDFHGGHDGFDAYFAAVSERFTLTEVARSTNLRRGEFAWTLYRVEPRD